MKNIRWSLIVVVLSVVMSLTAQTTLLYGNSVQKSLGSIPVLFVENAGQMDPRVSYYVPGIESTLYFTNRGIIFQMQQAKRLSALPISTGMEHEKKWILKLDFLGANTATRPIGHHLTPAVYSYFRGPQENWKTGVKTFASLKYSNLWPGIDLIYSGEVGKVKYTFVVNPGADPSKIRLRYQGASGLEISQTGELKVQTPMGPISDSVPYAIQEIAGKQKGVEVSYRLEPQLESDSHVYGFHIGQYDNSKPLIIDPAYLVFTGYIGGDNSDWGTGIGVDSQGYIYVGGTTISTENTFPVQFGPDLTYNGGNHDGFVAKLSNDGMNLLYVGYIGGCGDDYILDLAVDPNGYAYVTGSTDSPECFPLYRGPDLTWNGGGSDSFVTRIRPDGRSLHYSGFIGGEGEDNATGIAVDANQSAYVVGITNSDQSTFPVLNGPMLTYQGGESDVFISKVEPKGYFLEYSGYIGGEERDTSADVAVDSQFYAYIIGTTDSRGFPTKTGPDLSYNGSADIFVTKLDPTANFYYSSYFGGSNQDVAYAMFSGGIAVDLDGNAYITGWTMSDENTFPVNYGPDMSFNSTLPGTGDAFVAKILWSGLDTEYCGYIGGQNDDIGHSIAVVDGLAYVVGMTNSREYDYFPLGYGPDSTHNGGSDGWIAKVFPTGIDLYYSGYIGGAGNDSVTDIALYYWDAYVTGSTQSDETTFPVLNGPILTYSGNQDAFVARVDE